LKNDNFLKCSLYDNPGFPVDVSWIEN